MTPKHWLELSVDAPPEFVEPLTEIFRRYGEGGVAVEQRGGYNPDEGELPPAPERVSITAYLPIDATTDSRRAQIDVGVRLIARLAPISPLRERRISESDWRDGWKEFFHALRVGRRIVICPAWREADAREGDIVVRIDPGMAFGTGHHPTTRMCLEMLERMVEPGDRILDVGCGSGILSIAAAMLGAERAVGLEIDPVAARTGRANVETNALGDRVSLLRGTLPSPHAPPQSFDIVVANISARVVTDLAAHLVGCVAQGGALIASGILEERLDGVVAALEAEGATVRERFADGDWVAIAAAV